MNQNRQLLYPTLEEALSATSARSIAHSTERAAVAAAGFLRGGARLFQKPTVPKHSEWHQQGMDP